MALKVLLPGEIMKAETFINRLSKDYPGFKFKQGSHEHWSPGTKTVTYNLKRGLPELQCGLLHELSHALLDHTNYSSDFELLKMESEAWRLAAQIAEKYEIEISQDHIQNCLDTYRDWLHRRSTCPTCGIHVLQKNSATYHCFNCGTEWSVTSGRFVRAYRRRAA